MSDHVWKGRVREYMAEYRRKHVDKQKEYVRLWRKNTKNGRRHNRWKQTKTNCRRRGIALELTKDEYYELTDLPCAYCGDLPNPLNGVDRVDNKQGYLPSNVVACCEVCNKMKLDRSKEDFVAQCKKIVTHLLE